MSNIYGVRHIGGHVYYAFLEYKTKAEAKLVAKHLRSEGFGARVYHQWPDWVVYATRKHLR